MQSTKNKKIYFCSDIHGYYSEFISSLKEAGYDENNENNLLVVLGDINDRGKEFLKVYEYLKRLTDEGKAIVTSGNHHGFLIDFLEDKSGMFNYKYNGTDETIADLWHRTKPFESWLVLDNEEKYEFIEDAFARWQRICSKEINEEYPELLPWLKSLPRYFESKHYIGCHASLDLSAEDWRKPSKDWNWLEFDDGSFICHKNNTGKTVVCGHFYTNHLRKMWQVDTCDENDTSILKTSDNMVFIDGCVPLTHKVNIFIVEDELL